MLLILHNMFSGCVRLLFRNQHTWGHQCLQQGEVQQHCFSWGKAEMFTCVTWGQNGRDYTGSQHLGLGVPAVARAAELFDRKTEGLFMSLFYLKVLVELSLGTGSGAQMPLRNGVRMCEAWHLQSSHRSETWAWPGVGVMVKWNRIATATSHGYWQN